MYDGDTKYIGCEVIEFTPGSINVNYVLTFEKDSITPEEVDDDIRNELENPDGSFSGDVRFDNETVEVIRMLSNLKFTFIDTHKDMIFTEYNEAGVRNVKYI